MENRFSTRGVCNGGRSGVDAEAPTISYPPLNLLVRWEVGVVKGAEEDHVRTRTVVLRLLNGDLDKVIFLQVEVFYQKRVDRIF